MKHLTILIAGLFSQFALASDNKPIEFHASAETGWSSNSALTVAELDEVSTQSDSGMLLKANLSGKWQMSNKMQLQSNYSYKNQNFTDTNQYDLSMHLASIDANYALSWLTLGMRHDLAIASLDGDRFLRFNQSSLYGLKTLNAKTVIRANGNIKTKSFVNAEHRDAQSLGAGLDVFYFINAGDTMFSSGMNVEEESAVDPQFDFIGLNINSKLSHKFMLLGKNSQLSIAWRYQTRDYKQIATDPQIIDNKPIEQNESESIREDHQHVYQLQWQINLLANLAFKTEVEFGDYQSTLAQQTYQQTVTSFSLEASF